MLCISIRYMAAYFLSTCLYSFVYFPAKKVVINGLLRCNVGYWSNCCILAKWAAIDFFIIFFLMFPPTFLSILYDQSTQLRFNFSTATGGKCESVILSTVLFVFWKYIILFDDICIIYLWFRWCISDWRF